MRETNTTASPWLRELFTWGLYKRTQGRFVRQATFIALAVALAIGAWRASETLIGYGPNVRFVVPGVLLVVGWWICYRLVNMPRFADFLIAVEAEMTKVSWPSRGDLIRSSIVVLLTIVILAILLFGYDLAWQALLRSLGVVGN